jgi:hypothetical protein
MTIGTLLRALGVVVLVWTGILGTRAWPSFAALRDPASLPRATLVVDSVACEWERHDDHPSRCEARGLLHDAGSRSGRPAAYGYRAPGDTPEPQHAVGSVVRVAVVDAAFGDGVTLRASDSASDESAAHLRWLMRQPRMSLVVAVVAWLVLVLLQRRRRTEGILEWATWPGAPAVALAALGLGVALLAGWTQNLEVPAPRWGLVLLGLAAVAGTRSFWTFDRRALSGRRGMDVGPWRSLEPPVPLGGIAQVHLFETSRRGVFPPGELRRLVVAKFRGMVEIATGTPASMQRLGAAVATYFNVPLLDPLGAHVGGPPPLMPQASTSDDDVDPEEEEEEQGEWQDALETVSTEEVALPVPERRRPLVRSNLGRLPRALVQVAILAVIALVIYVVRMGGIDPATAHLLEPQVSVWPAGGVLRRAAVTVAAYRGSHPATLMGLVRLTHTLHPDDALWRPAVNATAHALGEDVSGEEPAVALQRIDLAAARALRMTLGPLGALGWREIDEYFVMWLDDLAGADTPLAIERFNRILPPAGLPTAEWYLAQLAPAFVDQRPIGFAIVAEPTADGWVPRAVPTAGVPADARRIAVTTVGQALRVGLWALPEYRPDSPEEDVDDWWAPIAAARGLPAPLGSLSETRGARPALDPSPAAEPGTAASPQPFADRDTLDP